MMNRFGRGGRISSPSSSSSSSSAYSNFRATVEDSDEDLPTYDPRSQFAQKKLARLRSAQNAIHFIPFLLLLSALILWFFSSSDERI